MRSVALLFVVCLSVLGDVGAGATQPWQPKFHTGVALIEVAVLVRDRDGRPVPDLTQAEFQIVEEGTPQIIAAFERVSLPIARAKDPKVRADASVPRDVASNEQVVDSRLFILVLDALHVAPQRARVVREYARQFIEERVGPTDLAAVVSPGGLASATQDFTSDKARLVAAVNQFSGTKLRSATVERDEEEQMAAVTGIIVHSGRDPSDTERADRVRSLTTVLEALAGHLDRVEGRRKALLLFSEGVDYNVFDALGVAQRYTTEVTRAMQHAVGALMRTNVAMYTIDPRALSSAEGDRVEAPLYSHPVRSNDVSNPGVEGEYETAIRSLRDLAEPTGGFAAVDRNAVSGAFERIVEDSSDYYVLGYTPSKPGKPGQFREIAVHVSRPGVRVTARKGYVTPSEGPRAIQADTAADAVPPLWAAGRSRNRSIEAPTIPAPPRVTPGLAADLGALLASPLPRAGLPLRVQAIPFRGDAKNGAVQLVVEVLGQSLEFTARGGRFEERIDLALLTIDDHGHAANGRSTSIDLRLPPDELERVKKTGVRWLSQLELPPGRYQIRVAGRATRTGTTGLVTHDVDVPPLEPDRMAMSGVMITSLPSVLMITRGSARLKTTLDTPPSAARTFVAGDHLTAAVEVYVPGSVQAGWDVVAQVEHPDGSTVVTIKETTARAKGQPRQDVAFALDTAPLAPGRYVLHVILSRAGGPDRVERHVPFEIVRRTGA